MALNQPSGQLGNQLERTVRAIPKILKALGGVHVVQISCGRKHFMVLTTGGKIYVWRARNYGIYEAVPLAFFSLYGIPNGSVDCGGNSKFAVSRSGPVFGWDKNSNRQLELKDTQSKHFPNQFRSFRKVRVCHISCGQEFSAILTLDGAMFTCGARMYGQVGYGSASNEILPRRVLELTESATTQVCCCRTHILALVALGEHVFSLDFGADSQLGTENSSKAATLQMVQALSVPLNESKVLESLKYQGVISRIFFIGSHCFAIVTKRSRQIPSLSYEFLIKCSNVPRNGLPDRKMVIYLKTVFRSMTCLTESFWLPNQRTHYRTSKDPCIDLKLVEERFSLIEEFENRAIRYLILDSITRFLLQSMSSLPIRRKALRVFLILPFYHGFDNPKIYYKLHKPFISALLSLPPIESDLLSDWFILIGPDNFERLIFIFKNVVSYIIEEQDIPSRDTIRYNASLYNALEMLWYLYKTNRKPESGPKVPYDTFYLPELSEYAANDYLLWRNHPDSEIILPNCVLCNSVHQGDPELFLCNYPFLFDASAKINVLKMYHLDSFFSEQPDDLPVPDRYCLELNVTRENIIEDALSVLFELSSFDLRNHLVVTFSGEEAEDGGGVQKEFFAVFAEEVLDPKYGVFKEYEETRTIWFSSDSAEDNTLMYYLIGLVCGLAIYNLNIINLPFPLALYKKLLEEPITLADLKDLSPTVANSLNSLLDYAEPDLEEVFLINFEITSEKRGEKRAIPLKENGDKIPVTQHNKQEFVDLYLDYIFNISIKDQYKAFSEGFKKVCGDDLSQLFRTQELMSVAIGNEDYDWDVLEEVAEYAEGYCCSDEIIQWFWDVIYEMSLEDKKKFLLFLTGCDRIPVGGMEAVKIEIGPGNGEENLPVAHTCFNLLDLPRYKSKEILRNKLLQAIQQTRGFSLY